MPQKKTIKIVLSIALLTVIGWGINYARFSFPIISGYNAKIMCSGVFLAGRDEKQILKQDLGYFPLNLASVKVNYKDSTVSASVLGLAKKKAIYIKGAGAILVNEISEKDIRNHPFNRPNFINQQKVNWPQGDRDTITNFNEVDSNELSRIASDAFSEDTRVAKGSKVSQVSGASRSSVVPQRLKLSSLPKQGQQKKFVEPKGTRALIILYKGHIIKELYAAGFTRTTPLLGWSMTKSVFSTLIGILCKDGKLNLNKPAPVPEWVSTKDPRHSILLINLLQQNSGLNFEEIYSRHSDATEMLFEKADMAHFTAEHSLQRRPGKLFYYSSGNVNILSKILRDKLGDQNYYTFPYQNLFYKLGMYHSTLEPDASGTFVGSSYMYATARDWARFGLLYYNSGIIGTDTLIANNYYSQSIAPSPSAKLGQYGFLFWLNRGETGKPQNRKLHHVPTDAFYADGFEGQIICIIPSKNLIVVRLGLNPGGGFNADELVSSIIRTIHN